MMKRDFRESSSHRWARHVCCVCQTHTGDLAAPVTGHLSQCHNGIITGQVNGLVYANMEEGMKNYGTEKHDGVTKTWDAVQREVGSIRQS